MTIIRTTITTQTQMIMIVIVLSVHKIKQACHIFIKLVRCNVNTESCVLNTVVRRVKTIVVFVHKDKQ